MDWFDAPKQVAVKHNVQKEWRGRGVALALALALCAGCSALPITSSILPLGKADSPSGVSGEPSLMQPSHHREWLPDLAILPYVEIDNETITVHNIRNSSYQSDTDYAVDYYDKPFDLGRLTSVDFIVVPFNDTPSLAHTMLSFGFEGDEYIGVSVEARLEKGEKYNPLLGVGRQFELMYVLADERDLIVRRTKHRGSDVFVYRTNATHDQARKLILSVAARVNGIYLKPEFYDTITNNCTTNIVRHLNELRDSKIPLFDMRVMLPGLADRLAYDLGLLDTSVPFEDLRQQSRVNDLANRNERSPYFSKLIRQ